MLALCATLVAGWVPSTSSIFGAQRDQIVDQLAGVPLPADRNWQTQLGSLWTLPADSLDTTGLGGGITFAFDPQLCGRIMPLFREDIAGASFITCDDIKASVFRAFNAWGTNSRFFKFTDVTAECETLGLLHGSQEEQPHGGCALAEIWITALTREESRRRRLQEARRRLHTEGGAGSPEGGGLHIESAEQNLDSGGLFVASALSHWRASYSFRYTNGEAAFQWALTGGEWERQPRPVLETYAGTLAYGVDGGSGGVGLCWYLDSTFCSQFHELKRRMGGPSQARSLMCALRLPSFRRHSPCTTALPTPRLSPHHGSPPTPRLSPAWQVRALPAHLPGHAAARLPAPRAVLAGAVRLRHQPPPLQEGEGGGAREGARGDRRGDPAGEHAAHAARQRIRGGGGVEPAPHLAPGDTSPLDLADISPRSPLWNPLLTSLQVMHLPYISRTSAPYLPCR